MGLTHIQLGQKWAAPNHFWQNRAQQNLGEKLHAPDQNLGENDLIWNEFQIMTNQIITTCIATSERRQTVVQRGTTLQI